VEVVGSNLSMGTKCRIWERYGNNNPFQGALTALLERLEPCKYLGVSKTVDYGMEEVIAFPES